MANNGRGGWKKRKLSPRDPRKRVGVLPAGVTGPVMGACEGQGLGHVREDREGEGEGYELQEDGQRRVGESEEQPRLREAMLRTGHHQAAASGRAEGTRQRSEEELRVRELMQIVQRGFEGLEGGKELTADAHGGKGGAPRGGKGPGKQQQRKEKRPEGGGQSPQGRSLPKKDHTGSPQQQKLPDRPVGGLPLSNTAGSVVTSAPGAAAAAAAAVPASALRRSQSLQEPRRSQAPTQELRTRLRKNVSAVTSASYQPAAGEPDTTTPVASTAATTEATAGDGRPRVEGVRAQADAESRKLAERQALCREMHRLQHKLGDRVGNRFVGQVPGSEVGDEFSARAQLQVAQLHMQPISGMDWGRRGSDNQALATAVVLAGCYAGNIDEGARVVYTGQGGFNKDKKESKDHRLARGNLAMFNSYMEGVPVRMIRYVKQGGGDRAEGGGGEEAGEGGEEGLQKKKKRKG